MAQVNAQYPNLAEMFGSTSMFPTMYGMDRFESAQNAEKLNQQQALQDILFNEQNNPLKLEASRLGNETTAAGLPGIFAQSDLMQDKAAVSRGSLGEQIAGAKGAARAQLSDSDLKILENGAQQMAMSRDPQERAMGEMLLKQHRSVVQEAEKQRQMALRQAELERVRGDEARKTQGQAIEAGKYVRGGSGGASDIEQALLSGKMGFEKAATATFAAAQEALARGDEAEAARLMDLANQYNRMRVQDRQAGARATQEGKVDLGAMGGVPVNGPQPVQQFTRPNPGATTPQQTQPVRVTSDADYNKLPPGTRFITPDGKLGTKR